DPLAALSPKLQVKYFLDKYSRLIYDVCDTAWVGCYHNQTDQALSNNYQKDITKKTVKLANHALNFLRIQRGKLNGELLESLAPVTASDFKTALASVRSFPKPEQQRTDRSLTEIARK